MSLEYAYYVFPDGGNSSLARLLEVYPQGVLWLGPTNLKDLPEIIKIMFQEKFNRFLKTDKLDLPGPGLIFNPAGNLPQSMLDLFSPQGDLLAHLDQSSKPLAPKSFFIISQYNPRTAQLINEFAQRASQKGAKVVLTFPSARQSSCDVTGDNFKKLYARLLSDIRVPLVGTPESYCFPDSYFYDTEYHLLRDGRRIRTEQMAKDLLPFIR